MVTPATDQEPGMKVKLLLFITNFFVLWVFYSGIAFIKSKIDYLFSFYKRCRKDIFFPTFVLTFISTQPNGDLSVGVTVGAVVVVV